MNYKMEGKYKVSGKLRKITKRDAEKIGTTKYARIYDTSGYSSFMVYKHKYKDEKGRLFVHVAGKWCKFPEEVKQW